MSVQKSVDLTGTGGGMRNEWRGGEEREEGGG